MTSTVKQALKDIAFIEVRAIEKSIEQTEKEMEDANKTIKRMETRIDNLDEKLYKQNKSLRSAKRQSADLKKFIWSSDNPNIVELRGELLLAAKLIKDDIVKRKNNITETSKK